MLNRNVPLVVCVGILTGAALAQTQTQNPQGVGYVVQFVNPSTASGQLQVIPANTTSLSTAAIANTGPAGPNLIVAKPDGSKFYIMGATGLDSIDPAFTTPKSINGLSGTFTQAVISPDGRFLFLSSSTGSGSGTVYVINTTNDTVVLNEPVTGSVIGVVVSRDSTTAWILGESSGTFITTLALSNQSQVGTPIFLRNPLTGGTVGGDATSFSISPLGLLYVTAGNQVLEISPAILKTCQAAPLTCAPITVISVDATPGPLQFTEDGAYAFFINQTPQIGGQALLRISFPNHSINNFASIEAFDSILVASGQSPYRIFAHSAADTTLWDVAPDLSAVTVSALSSILPATQVSSVVVSGELPSSQYLFAVAGGSSLATIYRVSLSSNTVTGQAATSLGLGPLQYVYVPQEANPATILTYNTPQTVAVGGTAATLYGRVLDANGNPVFAVPVTFTGDSSLTFAGVSATTNADGYVQATVTVGQTPGYYPVTLTAGTGTNSATATFSVTIPGGSTGGVGNGPNQLSIIAGNGQLFQAGQLRLGNPNSILTVQLVDTSGKPLQNQNVTFMVTGAAIATIDTPNATTDVNGMATTDFFPGFPGQNFPFQATNVTATATSSAGQIIGAVVFVETIWQPNPDGTGGPSLSLLSPASDPFTLQGGEGDVIPEAFVEAIFADGFGSNQAVPNIGVRIASADDATMAGPGVCQGNPLSDQLGHIHCQFIPACATSVGANGLAIGLGLHGFSVVVGETAQQFGDGVNITAGSTQTLTIPSNGGNNQTGRPGSTLPLSLSAVVTDQCGTVIPGVTVTWQITQGSASLSAATSVTVGNGAASTRVTLGANPGTVTITGTINGSTKVTFTETGTAIVGTLGLVSGGGQTALEGKTFTQPLVFQINNSSQQPLAGISMSFLVTGGSASLNVQSGVTNSQGQASVTVTAGQAPGTVTVTASYSTFSASASLTVQAPGPGVNPSNFVNAASLQQGLVPCGLATVTGTGLAAGVNGVVAGNPLGIGPLPYTLQGVSISVGLIPAPILSVSNQNGVQQVNFQTPCEVPPTGNGTVVVEVNGASSTVTGVNIAAAQPGIFTYAGPGGLNYGWIIDASNGNYLTPSYLAHAGGTYYLVATGLGQTTPAATTNAPGTGSQVIPVNLVILAIDNIGVPVTTVQYLEGAIGEYIITFTIPSTANGQPFPTGTNLPITLGVNVNGQTQYDPEQIAVPGIH